MKEQLEFRQSRNMVDYEPFVTGLSAELGPEFGRSMRNWCGLESRPYPLLEWEVFIVERDGRPVGVCSYYRQSEDARRRYWIGWIGVLKEERRHGTGSAMLRTTENHLQSNFRAREAWVYTDTADAIAFYKANGYQPAGVFGEQHLTQAAARAESAVLRKILV